MKRINSTTRLAGVIGWPLDHSLSPSMHNAVYEALGLDWAYVPLPVADEIGLRRLVAAIRSLPNVVGFNVTMPYKQAMLELCDEVAMMASMADAVNTVHCVDGRLIGYNTDGRGLVEALETETGFSPAGKRVVLVGAGGAAGAAFVSFLLSKAADITVVNRTVNRADELVDRMMPHLRDTTAAAVPWANAEEPIRTADVIVNCTSVGMKDGDPSPLPIEWMRPGQVVCDMVYRSTTTALVAAARAAGASAMDGLPMLVAQGATAIDIWHNSAQTRTPREVMRAAAEAEIAARLMVEGAMPQ